MALSNWDTLMINEERLPIPGMWVSDSGIGVELYKNWINIHDKKAWVPEAASYTEPIVMKIDEGQIDYKDIHILALRGPQEGVYLMVWKDYYSKDSKKYWIKGAMGCGVYGFSENGRYVGVTKTSIRWFHKEVNQQEVSYDTYGGNFKNGKKKKDKKMRFLHSVYDVPDLLKKTDLSKAQRYNQGDAFFTAHLSTPLQNTTPGKAKNTVMHKMIECGRGQS